MEVLHLSWKNRFFQKRIQFNEDAFWGDGPGIPCKPGTHENPTNFRRELDFETAITELKYEVEGTKFTREVFSSPADQAIIVNLQADGEKKLNFFLAFRKAEPEKWINPLMDLKEKMESKFD